MNGEYDYRKYISKDSLGYSERKEELLKEEDIRRIAREENSKKKTRFPWFRVIALMLLSAIIGSGITGVLLNRKQGNVIQGNNPNSHQTINISEESNVENAVAQKTTPSVVGITTLAPQENMLFQQGGALTEGIGSGVIVSGDGYILTNSHVVRDGKAESIEVILSDSEKIPAKLLWNDATLDLAVIKADKGGLTPVELGDSDKVHVGDKAIAIGNPLGMDLQSTLTSGYISGLNRSISLQAGMQMDGLIQTDAAINPGNSGGALLNAKGELIGVNTAKAGEGEGIGFAIPINLAIPIVNQIIETGAYDPVLLGISGIDVGRYNMAVGQELPVNEGVIIMEVQGGSAAERSGLQRGDIILSIDENKTGNMNQLKKALITHKAGDEVQIKILRGEKEESISLKFE